MRHYLIFPAQGIQHFFVLDFSMSKMCFINNSVFLCLFLRQVKTDYLFDDIHDLGILISRVKLIPGVVQWYVDTEMSGKTGAYMDRVLDTVV